MSERMIELQRAKLGLPPAGQSPSIQNPSVSPKPSPHSPASKRQQLSQTPQEAAVAAMRVEDSQMERFINRLQQRDDSNPAVFRDAAAGGASHGRPTVPTALSRRMLQRQGVGYLDNTVAAVVSASADRFLATVLQQAVACRDQRLKGAVMAREAAKHRKRHLQHYEEDTDDRKRRKEMIDDAREKVAMDTINRAETLKRQGAAKAAAAAGKDSKTATKKKATKKKDEGPENGIKVDPATRKLAEEEEEEYDSIDEEEEYYQEKVGDANRGAAGDEDDNEEEEDEDDTLLLRDVARPLEAWNFHLSGKEDLDSDVEEPDDDEDDGDDTDEDDTDAAVGQTQENGKDDNNMAFANGTDGKKSESSNDDEGGAETKKKNATS